MNTLYINQPLQTGFSVQTNCNELLSALKLKHGKYAKATGTAAYTVTVTKTAAGYKVACNGQEQLSASPLRAVEEVMYHLRDYDPEIFAIHGAAVQYQNGAYLFVAGTTGGKTTLTAYLTTVGFAYITDDCILLNRKNNLVYPFQTPLHLRQGGYQVLQQAAPKPIKTQVLNAPDFWRITYTPSLLATGPVPLKKIYFIERTGQENRVVPMSTTERITALLKSPIKNYRVDGNYLRYLTKLAQTPCERLLYHNMAFVAEVIKNDE